MERITFGAGQLVKCSAARLKFLRTYPDKAYVETPDNITGNAYADFMSKGYVEMTGAYKVNQDTNKLIIFYPFDEIRIRGNERIFIEHKWIKDLNTIEPWFFESSICQIALMASLHQLNERKIYATAKFRVKAGHDVDVLDLSIQENTKEMYVLNFGGQMFELTVTPEPIRDHFINKAIASLTYTDAKLWDIKYKYKDYEMIKEYITFKRIKRCTTITAYKKTIDKEKNFINFRMTAKRGKRKE